MSLVQNIPCFSILLSMFAAILTSAVKGKSARRISLSLAITNIVLSALLLIYMAQQDSSFVYVMGHVPAPWGNELRAGVLEAGMAAFFSLIMLLSLLGGLDDLKIDLEEDKASFYYIMADLMLAANLALVYTNDLFTAYVFVEINTIAACGLILGRFRGRTVASAIQYMIMSSIGSGMLLLGLCFLYDITGHLLMSNINQVVSYLPDHYRVPLLLSVALMTVGLGIKCALWPFHTWLPNSYGTSTTSSSCMLSSIISKGYIFLLIKIIYRVIGFDIYSNSRIISILFVLGIIGMISGSIDAIRQANIRRMVSYSSVAQIGYIFMGIGLGTVSGMNASMYHIFAHASAKSLAFLAIAGMMRAANGNFHINSLKGVGYKNKIAAIGFLFASFSMIGIPGTAGFVSKFMFARASLQSTKIAAIVLVALAISTLLNTFYFMRVALIIYTPLNEQEKLERDENPVTNTFSYNIAIVIGIIANLCMGILTGPMNIIVSKGLMLFG